MIQDKAFLAKILNLISRREKIFLGMISKRGRGGAKIIKDLYDQKKSDHMTESSTSNWQLDSELDLRKAAILEARQDNAKKQKTARAILADSGFSQKDSYEQLLHKEMLRITEKRDEVLNGQLAMLGYPEDEDNEYWHHYELKSLNDDQSIIHKKFKEKNWRDPYA